MLRLSRGCYDKYRRCPGWAGGGLQYAKVQRCADGSLGDVSGRPLWRLRFNHCATCGVVVLPHATKWLDPSWLRSEFTRHVARRRDARDFPA